MQRRGERKAFRSAHKIKIKVFRRNGYGDRVFLLRWIAWRIWQRRHSRYRELYAGIFLSVLRSAPFLVSLSDKVRTQIVSLLYDKIMP